MEKIKILISGDYCPIGRNENLIRNGEYNKIFKSFVTVREKVDFGIVNLECPITTSNNKIAKTGPCLKSEHLNSLNALKFAGFDLVTLANNHILDYGSKGVTDTISNLKKVNISFVGAGENREEAQKPFILKIKGKSIGIINIAENEFCSSTKNSAGAYTFDLIENLYLINDLRPKVDYILLIYHGGREHYQLPTPELKKRFKFFLENGVDAIVGHHTHCFSGFEFINKKPIIYSLGNFLFDYKPKYRKGTWTEGYSCILEFGDSDIKVNIIPHFQGRENDQTLELATNEKHDLFLSNVLKLNEIITDETRFFEKWSEYLNSQSKYYISNFLFKNKYLRYLISKGYFPLSFLPKYLLLILNLLRCETHNEISRNVIEQALKINER